MKSAQVADAATAAAKSAASPKTRSRFGKRSESKATSTKDSAKRATSKQDARKGGTAKKAGASQGSQQRNPLIPAAIAGLLALAGAFLLVTSLRGGEATATEEQLTSTVLVVKTPLEQGTTVEELLADPALFLSAKAVPARYAAATAISSVQELSELNEMMLAVDILPGEQLLTGRFVERNDFERESYIDRSIGVEVPAGHHQVVLEIPAARALGGNIRPGDVVTVLSGFRVEPVDEEGAARRPVETSLIVLNAVEVLNVQIVGLVGELAADTDTVGIATTGDLNVTLAVTPEEITDLTYAIQYGEIILAVAIDESKDSTQRSITVIDSILTGEDLVLDGSVPELISNAPQVEAAENQSGHGTEASGELEGGDEG